MKISHISAGIFGGTILGVALFLILMTYGGNYGCNPFIDTLTGLQGYESCGLFGAIFGIGAGTVAGVALMRRSKSQNSTKASIALFLGAFIVPFLYGAFTFNFIQLFTVATPVILFFMGLALVVSLFVAIGFHFFSKIWHR